MGVVYNTSIVRDGLVFYLDASNPKSYIGSGVSFFDLTTNSNDGTLLNGVGYNSNSLGAFTFDGSNDYISLSSASLLPTGTSDRTIIAFCKTPTSFTQNYHHVIHYGSPILSQAFGLAILSNGTLNTHPWSGAPAQGIVVPGTKYCLAVSYTHSSTLHKF